MIRDILIAAQLDRSRPSCCSQPPRRRPVHRAPRFYLRAAEQAFLIFDLDTAMARAALGLACAPSLELRNDLLGLRCEVSRAGWKMLGDTMSYAEQLTRSASPGSIPWVQGMLAYHQGLMVTGRIPDLVASVDRLRGVDAAPDAVGRMAVPLEHPGVLGTLSALRLAQGRVAEAVASAEDAVARCRTMEGCGMFRGAFVRLARAEGCMPAARLKLPAMPSPTRGPGCSRSQTGPASRRTGRASCTVFQKMPGPWPWREAGSVRSLLAHNFTQWKLPRARVSPGLPRRHGRRRPW